MPVARATGWRIRAGTWTAAGVTSTYAVESLALQTDQGYETPWTIDSAGTTTPTPARITTNADSSRSPDGYQTWKWRFSYMTFGMTSYWNGTVCAFGTAWSAPVTIMTYDENNVAVFLQCLIWRPNYPSDKAQYAPGGWGSVIYEFTHGVITS